MQRQSWKELCNSYHFDPRIEWSYRSDWRYSVDACLVADVDNTLTKRPTLTDNYLAYIFERSEIRPRKQKIVNALRLLSENPYAVKQSFDTIFLKELYGVLRKDVHEDACLNAANITAPPPRTSDLMFDMRDRDVTTLVLTFGMEDALVPWYWYKVGVPVHTLAGTKLVFENGRLVGYDMGGAYGKVSRALSLTNSLGFKREHVIVLSDDPVIDRSVAAVLGVGLMVWLDDDSKRRELASKGEYAYPGENVVVLENADEDRRRITEYVDKKLRAEFVSETVPPSRILALLEEFNRFESAIETCRRCGANNKEKLKEAADSCGRVLSLGRPFVPMITNDVEGTFARLRSGLYTDGSVNDMLSWTEDIRSTLKRENPEFSMRKDMMERISLLA